MSFGEDKGAKGRILKIFRESGKALVEGIKLVGCLSPLLPLHTHAHIHACAVPGRV